MTMNTSWGYKWYDNNWKSAQTLIQMLVDIASKGGNLLLNVGPTAEGIIPDSSVVRLEQIGSWMKMNGESIYGTSASPFFKLTWGRCTQRQENGNTTLYLHVFNWPKDQVLRIPGLKTKIQDVYLLTNPKQKFAWKFENGDALVHAPSVIFDPINTVIVVKTKGNLEITSNMPTLKDGRIELPAEFADIHNPGYGTHARIADSGKNAYVTNWSDSKVKVEWMFNAPETGDYVIEASVLTADTCMAEIKIGNQTIKTSITQNTESFKTVKLGEVNISKTGNHIITISPVKDAWKSMDLSGIQLIKK
jgi:alpha-L-fucosidase